MKNSQAIAPFDQYEMYLLKIIFKKRIYKGDFIQNNLSTLIRYQNNISFLNKTLS